MGYAQSLAEKNGVEVPEGALLERQQCSEFIDQQLEVRGGAVGETFGARPPSEKQLQYAQSLAEQNNVEVPEGALLDSGQCSDFIDQQLEVRGGAFGKTSGGWAPTQKQLQYAQSLAERSGVEIPEGALQDKQQCSDFISQQLEGRGPIPIGSQAPSEKQLAYAKSLAEDNGVDIPDEIYDSRASCSDFIEQQLAARGSRPSQRQIEFAASLAQAMGMNMPERARTDRSYCSEFIDELKSKNDGVYPPSSKQIASAESLAESAGLPLPEDVMKDSRACSRFIDEHKIASG